MTSAFSSNESESLERGIEVNKELVTKITEIWQEDDLKRCAEWILQNNFKRISLQFPDDLLCYSTAIVSDIMKICEVQLFVLGDTSYGSCCVDEVAAAHVAAEGMIHFGHACLSRVTHLPVIYIFSKLNLDRAQFFNTLESTIENKVNPVHIFYDVGYHKEMEQIKKQISSGDDGANIDVIIAELAIDEASDVLCWKLTEKDLVKNDCVFVGRDNQTFFNLTMAIPAQNWYIFDTLTGCINKTTPMQSNWMKRRYFYIEKCKDAQSIGIVVGTLSSEGYLKIVKHIQELAKKNGIRSYIMSVGKVNPAKLANFPEVDCFVLVGCPENTIFNSREFYKPLVSVFEVEMALNPAWHQQLPDLYCTEFKEMLPNGKLHRNTDGMDVVEHDISLVTGRVRNKTVDENGTALAQSTAMIEIGRNEVSVVSSSDAFANRSWQGLEPSLGQNEPAVIERGRSGIPLQYTENPIETNNTFTST